VPLLHAYLKSDARGSDRLIGLLARRLKSLQVAPISLPDAPPVYVDLRLPTSRDFFRRDLRSWEHGIREVIKRLIKGGSVAYDIGANIGLHTALLSRLVGPSGTVVAFEPNPELFHSLKTTCDRLGNVKLIREGLSNHSAVVEFFIPTDHTMASLHNWTSQPTTNIQIVVTPLDGLYLPPPDFIKCDVEGHELEVFQGAEQLLRKHKPSILFESYSQNSDNHVAAPKFLQSLGYELHSVSKDGELTHLKSLEYTAVDVLAI